jgi:oligoendopeptidase F
MKEIYETAGIRFDFSADYIKELMDFLKIEIEKVSAE